MPVVSFRYQYEIVSQVLFYQRKKIFTTLLLKIVQRTRTGGKLSPQVTDEGGAAPFEGGGSRVAGGGG